MKRSIFSLGLMLSALFTLTNCAKELDAPASTPEQEGIPFEITAPMEDATKTSNDGLATRWVTGDEMNVFYAEAGTTAYSDNRKFSIAEADIASGLFKGSLNEQKPLAASNDWYALYPFDNHMHSPVNTYKNGAYLVIGSKASSAQSQEGAGNMRHIAGADYPLYGVAEGVPQGNVPTFSMKQVAALLKVAVKNNTGEELPVSSVKFTAPVDIVGTFYIDFSKEPLSFAGSGKDFVSRTAALTVRNASVPAGGTGEFYLAFKPFKAEAQDLTVEVNGYAKTIKAATTDFAAGKIKTLNFNFDKVIEKLDGNYAVLVQEGKEYFSMLATDTDNNDRLDYADVQNFTGGKYTTSNAAEVWTIVTSGSGYTLSNNGKYLSPSKNGSAVISLGKNQQAPVLTITGTSESGIYTVVGDCGKAGNRSLKKNGNYGFGFYSGTKNTVLLVPAEYVSLPALDRPVVEVLADDAAHTVTVSWNEVPGATSYEVSCGTFKTETVAAGVGIYEFTAVPYGGYQITVTAKAEGYLDGISEVQSIVLKDPSGAHDGSTAETAYTVAEAVAIHATGTASKDPVWVKAAVVGTYNNGIQTSGFSDTNLVLGTESEFIIVQLPKGELRNSLSLKQNEGNLGKTVAVKGLIQDYFGSPGLKNCSEYIIY